MIVSGIYEAIAAHVAEGRAPDIDAEAFCDWLAEHDSGDDPDWRKIDDAIDSLVDRFRER